MEPRPIRVRETTHVLRIGSLRVRRHRGRVVEFEDAPNRDGSRVERESNGRRPSKQKAEDGGSRGVNLPLLLAAHLGRSKNRKTLQSTLTSGYGGNQPSTNSGGIFFLTILGLHEEQRIFGFVHGLKKRSLVEFLSTDLPTTYKGLKMGIVVSTIHKAIKFHTSRGIDTVFSTYEPNKVEEGHKKIRETIPEVTKNVISCVDTEEKIIVNDNTLSKNQAEEAWIGSKTKKAGYKVAYGITKEGILREVKDQTWVANPLMHQIKIAKGDEDETAFFIGKGVFCYQKMPFGLKNARATYQRLVDKVFNDQIRLWSINMKQNLNKCSFGVEEGPFLEHLFTKQGIKANTSKFKAIINMKPPRTLKEIQSLNEKSAALSRFFSKGADKSLPFFKTLKSCTEKKTIQPENSGQIAKWAIELGKHDIKFEGRESVKGWILADFLVLTPFVEEKDMEIKKPKAVNKAPNTWKLYNDKALSFNNSGAGLMLVSPEGKEYTYASRFEFETTNNEAEYETLLAGLRIANEMEIRDLAIFIDPQLVANQVKGLLEARQLIIKQYLEKTKGFSKSFDTYSVEHI
nr:reverse transcriptase domain-containing protein [Tanacetum cinerariifolium]